MHTLVRPSALFLVSILALGCGRGSGLGGDSDAPHPIPTVLLPGVTPQPDPTPTPAPANACSDIYDPDLLPVFHVDVDAEIWQRMEEEYPLKIENWYGPATFRFGDEERTVRIRTRGNNSRCFDKLQITIDFDEYEPDYRFHGLRRIDLDHGGNNCRTVEERVALAWMREDLGLPAQCANHAMLYVNNQYYGLFTNLEHQDREFLERNFEDPDGNLYKSGNEKKTNESDPDTSDLAAFWAASTPAQLDAIADIDQMMFEWAAEAVMPARDNFWIWGWNYYLYNEPGRGFVFIPNDMDQAGPSDKTIDFEPLPANVEPATWLLEHPEYRERFLETLRDVYEKFDADRFAERIDTYWAQVGEAAQEDRFLGWPAGSDRFASVKARYFEREAFLGEWLSCASEDSLKFDADGDGYRWCEECSDDDPSVNPGAIEVCGNGTDDDCDGEIDDGCAPPPPPAVIDSAGEGAPAGG